MTARFPPNTETWADVTHAHPLDALKRTQSVEMRRQEEYKYFMSLERGAARPSDRPFVRVQRRGARTSRVRLVPFGPATGEFNFDEPELQPEEEFKRERVLAANHNWWRTVQLPMFIQDLLPHGVSPKTLFDVLMERIPEMEDLRGAAVTVRELAHLGYRPLVTEALREWASTATRRR
jgi:hypothetical protein